jgi:hypothetical protein
MSHKHFRTALVKLNRDSWVDWHLLETELEPGAHGPRTAGRDFGRALVVEKYRIAMYRHSIYHINKACFADALLTEKGHLEAERRKASRIESCDETSMIWPVSAISISNGSFSV